MRERTLLPGPLSGKAIKNISGRALLSGERNLTIQFGIVAKRSAFLCSFCSVAHGGAAVPQSKTRGGYSLAKRSAPSVGFVALRTPSCIPFFRHRRRGILARTRSQGKPVWRSLGTLLIDNAPQMGD